MNVIAPDALGRGFPAAPPPPPTPPFPPSPAAEPEDAGDTDAEHPRRELRAGLLVGGLFFAGLLGAAALVPMDAAAYAEGIVAVSGHRQAVQHRDGGIVTGLRVSEGAMVRKNDVLLTVSAPELVASERAVAGETVFLLALRARLRAELAGGPLAAPAEFATLPDADRATAREALDGQRQLLDARRASLDAERDVLHQRMQQHTEQIGGYRHQIAANEEQQRLIARELAGLRELEPRGFVSKTRLWAVERTASELNGTQGAFRAEIARSQAASGEARLQVVSLRKQVITEAAGQLRDVQVRLDELQPRLAALREQLGRQVVRANATGRVVNLAVFTEGGVVAAGATLMEIVPRDRQLIVEGRVAPGDADDLRPGMATQVRFSGIHERNLPILHGRLARVSADSLEDPRSGARYFHVEVEVPPDQLARIRRLRPEGAVGAGLPVEVMIPLRQRSALQYLTEPLTQSLWRAGREQ